MSKFFLIFCIAHTLCRHMRLDNLIDTVRVAEIVNTPDIIALLEYEVSIIEDAGEESVFFYINFEDTLDIHELYIIDEYEARMTQYNGLFAYEHDPPIEVYDIEHYLYDEII